MNATNELTSVGSDCPVSIQIPTQVKKPSDPRRDKIEVQLLRLFGRTMERASWETCRLTGAWAGLAFFHGARRRREIAVSNVRLALPHLTEAAARQIARRSAQNFGMMFCESLHLRTATAREIREYSDIEGLENIQEGFKQGRGVILLTAHLGNWEVMGARAAQEFPLTVVARPSSNSGVQEHITSVRCAAGINIISKYDTARASLHVLRANESLGILPDQHAGPEGILLPLFGHPTRFVPALARLAMMSRALVVPAFGVRCRPWLRDGRIIAKVAPGFHLQASKDKGAASREDAIVAGTRQIIQHLENIVRQYPDQWLWMHRRWRTEDAAFTIPD